MKHDWFVFRSRLQTLRKDIFYTAIIFAISIIAIELWLKYIPGKYEFQYDFGQIYLKICYSFVAATFFYYVVVHLPKESRKAKAFRFINNKALEIDREVSQLVEVVGNIGKVKLEYRGALTRLQIGEACKKINPQLGFVYNIESSVPFSNWFEYLKFKGDRIKMAIQELLLLNDAIDSDFLQSLTLIYDEFSKTMNFDRQNFANQDLSTWAYPIYEITRYTRDMTNIMSEKYKRYAREYHHEFRKKNTHA